MTEERTLALVEDLLRLHGETAWVEFKHNNADPHALGVRISALSNAARLVGQNSAYMIWGIRDQDHAIVGTTFDPWRANHQQQPLEFWLAQRLNPSIAFAFRSAEHPNGRLVLLEVPAATSSPIEFERVAYIRIGSATPRLADYPERLQALWSRLRPYAWETGIAAQFVSGDEVLARLDYAGYFDLTGQPLPDNRQGIFERLAADRLIHADAGGRWNVTNLGAILYAKRLGDFEPAVARKAIRFVAYGGSNRAATVIHRQDGQRGYASGFKALVEYIDGLLPHNEAIGRAFRTESPLFPSVAIRELVANALIHQDMTISGAGPLIELFKDRLEITNPGEPLIQPSGSSIFRRDRETRRWQRLCGGCDYARSRAQASTRSWPPSSCSSSPRLISGPKDPRRGRCSMRRAGLRT